MYSSHFQLAISWNPDGKIHLWKYVSSCIQALEFLVQCKCTCTKISVSLWLSKHFGVMYQTLLLSQYNVGVFRFEFPVNSSDVFIHFRHVCFTGLELITWETQCQWNNTEGYWSHDDVIKWKHFPRYWPFVREIHRYPVNSPHKGQWRGALMFSSICVWINDWENNRGAGDLRRYHAPLCRHCNEQATNHNKVQIASIIIGTYCIAFENRFVYKFSLRTCTGTIDEPALYTRMFLFLLGALQYNIIATCFSIKCITL